MSKAKGYSDFDAGAHGSIQEVPQADEEGRTVWPSRGDALARGSEHVMPPRVDERPADDSESVPGRPDLHMPVEGRPDLAPNAGTRQRNA